MSQTTLVEILEANRDAKRTVTYIEAEQTERSVAYADVYKRAVGILALLQGFGARPGDKLIIFLNNNEQFLDGFWAAICGGIVPVPLAVGISDEHRHKLLRIARKLGSPFLYTDRKNFERLETFAKSVGEPALLEKIKKKAFLVDSIVDIAKPGKMVKPSPSDVAFIQFSSGSTSEPKGVVLTHGNLIANIRGATEAANFCSDDVSLSWMPLTHDMGLIGLYLMQLANRAQINLMPTELFIRRPLLWLQVAAAKRATVLCSPNFGYRHFLKVLGERKLDGVDLSAVRVLFNGAEPISVDLCNDFMSALTYTGLKRDAMLPVYGLAEATLAVSFAKIGNGYRWIRVNRHRLNTGDPLELNPADSKDALELMCVGKPIPFTEVRIADATRAALPLGRVGHVLIRGANVTHGYFENPEADAIAIDADGWLDTGDLGVMHEGELYITGRAKEIIFVNGQNYYPHDLEAIAQRAPGLELGKVAAAGVRKPGAQIEELTIFVLHRMDMAEFLPTALAVARLVNEHAGLEVANVVPVKRIPKTTSGKIQRHLLENAYVSGEFAGELAELDALRAAAQATGGGVSRTDLESRLKTICDAALAGKAIDIHDNLFEIGASSLKLIEIHENIDKDFPGLVDLTELFDFPTIHQLATHLETKIAAGTP
jgi:acyl-CoA synthetase (AMP-forming)/AMP-acid ligase II/acyl carrier protein